MEKLKTFTNLYGEKDEDCDNKKKQRTEMMSEDHKQLEKDNE